MPFLAESVVKNFLYSDFLRDVKYKSFLFITSDTKISLSAFQDNLTVVLHLFNVFICKGSISFIVSELHTFVDIKAKRMFFKAWFECQQFLFVKFSAVCIFQSKNSICIDNLSHRWHPQVLPVWKFWVVSRPCTSAPRVRSNDKCSLRVNEYIIIFVDNNWVKGVCNNAILPCIGLRYKLSHFQINYVAGSETVFSSITLYPIHYLVQTVFCIFAPISEYQFQGLSLLYFYVYLCGFILCWSSWVRGKFLFSHRWIL